MKDEKFLDKILLNLLRKSLILIPFGIYIFSETLGLVGIILLIFLYLILLGEFICVRNKKLKK